MKRSVFFPLVVLLVCLCAVSVGCKKRTATIEDISNANLSTYGKLTATQVHDAIVRGGSNAGWVMKDEKAGLVIASLSQREHAVTVEIPYTAKEYTIHYRDSVNMDADGTGQIHRNYPNWINRLSRAINAELSQIKK